MMKNAWRTLAAVGLVTSFAVVGCVVGSSDDEGTGGSAGATSGGGSGGSTGGTAGTTTGGTGGTAGAATGGTGGTTEPYTCDPDGSLGSTPGSCEPADANDPCQACIKQYCCVEYSACLGTGPNNPCGWGGPKNDAGEYPGEIFCIQACIVAGGTLGDCAGQCASDGCGTIADATNSLAACLDSSCPTQCFQ